MSDAGFFSLAKQYKFNDTGRMNSVWEYISTANKAKLAELGITHKLMPIIKDLLVLETRNHIKKINGGYASRTEKHLADRLGKSERTIRYYVQEMDDKNIFKVMRKKNPLNHKYLPNRYCLRTCIKKILIQGMISCLRSWGLWKKPEATNGRDITIFDRREKETVVRAFSASQVDTLTSDLHQLNMNIPKEKREDLLKRAWNMRPFIEATPEYEETFYMYFEELPNS